MAMKGECTAAFLIYEGLFILGEVVEATVAEEVEVEGAMERVEVIEEDMEEAVVVVVVVGMVAVGEVGVMVEGVGVEEEGMGEEEGAIQEDQEEVMEEEEEEEEVEVEDMVVVVEEVDMEGVDMVVVEEPEKSMVTLVITYELLIGASTLCQPSRRTSTAPPPA